MKVHNKSQCTRNIAVAALTALLLSACLTKEEAKVAAVDPADNPSGTPPPNSSPQISGAPPASVNTDNAYSFTPTANDPDGDALSFSVTGLPVWADFDTTNGRLSGTPQEGDVGVFSDIVISVSDGELSASLASFSVTVDAISLGSVTLSWTPPLENTDGTALTDLAGYNIYWGPSPGNYPNSVKIDNGTVSTYVVDNLAPGTYEFVATSFNFAGAESSFSNSATRVVQ